MAYSVDRAAVSRIVHYRSGEPHDVLAGKAVCVRRASQLTKSGQRLDAVL